MKRELPVATFLKFGFFDWQHFFKNVKFASFNDTLIKAKTKEILSIQKSGANQES